MPRPEVQILANQDAWVVEAIHCIYCWQPRLLSVWLHAFLAVQYANHISVANAKLPREVNLIYCLIYLDDIVVFSHTAEEHLHCLHIIFDQFREHNLKLKALKCNIFREEITYLAHQVSKDGVWPSNSNLKAITECKLPLTYTEVRAFLGLVGHYWRFIKVFAALHSHVMSIWLEKEPAGSQSKCHFQRMPWRLLRH